MKLTQQEANLIKTTWAKEFTNTKKCGTYLYKMNAPCLTGVFIKIDKAVSRYEIWVETRLLHRQNAGLVQRRFHTSFGNFENRHEVKFHIYSNSLLGDELYLNDGIKIFEYKKANQIYLEPWAVEASSVLRFIKFGFHNACDYLDSIKLDWNLWPLHIREKYNMSFEYWCESVISNFDLQKIRKAVQTELDREKLKLHDFGFVDFRLFS